jgi:hypothetical protein
MAKQVTTDHGNILHFAGAHHLFPVAKKADGKSIRLTTHDAVEADDVRIGWDAFFRPFIDRGLVFLHDEATGQPVTKAEAEKALQGA